MPTTHPCDDAIEQVYTYLDGEMTWFHRVRVQRHLRRCNPCNEAFEFEARFKEFVRRKCSEPAPPELIERLRSFLRDHRDDVEA